MRQKMQCSENNNSAARIHGYKQPRQNHPCYELNAQIKRNALRLFVQRDIHRLAGQSNKGCSGGNTRVKSQEQCLKNATLSAAVYTR